MTKGIVFLQVQGKVYRHKIDHKVDTVNLKTFYTHEALGFLSFAATETAFAIVLLICKLHRILLVQLCKRSSLRKLNG